MSASSFFSGRHEKKNHARIRRRVLENLHVDVEGFDGVQNQSSECWLEA